MAPPIGRLVDPLGILPLPGGWDPGPFEGILPGKSPLSTWDSEAHSTKEAYERQALDIISAAEKAAGKSLPQGERTEAMNDIAAGLQAGSVDVRTSTAKLAENIRGSSPGTPGQAPAGWIWVQNPSTDVWTLVEDKTFVRPGAPRTQSQEAADQAAANAHNAQAGLYGQQAADLARIALIAGTPVQGAPGYIYDQNGRPVDITAAQLNADQLRELARHNLQVEIDSATNTRQQGEYQRGQLTEAGLSREQTGAYQRGQLEIQRGELANSASRLALDRATAEANIRAKQQENALARNRYVADILSKPSDFMARVITQRGLGNPTPVTQADLISQINNEFAGLQPGQSLAPPQPQSPLGVPQLAQGGMVHDPKMIVGDPQQSGVPNPELILNPTGAPISVIPMNRLMPADSIPQYAQGTGQQQPQQSEVDPETKLLETKVTSLGKLLQFVDNPDTQHELVDELAFYKKKLGRGLPPKEPNLLDDVRGRLSRIPQYAEGTVDVGMLYQFLQNNPGNPDLIRQANEMLQVGQQQQQRRAAVEAENAAAPVMAPEVASAPAPTSRLGEPYGYGDLPAPAPASRLGEPYGYGDPTPIAPTPAVAKKEADKVGEQAADEARKAALIAYMNSEEGAEELRKSAINIAGGVAAGAAQGAQGSLANIKALMNRFGIKVGKADMDLLRLPSPHAITKADDAIELYSQELRKSLESFLSDFRPGASTFSGAVKGALNKIPRYANGTGAITLDPNTNQWMQGGNTVDPFNSQGNLDLSGISTGAVDPRISSPSSSPAPTEPYAPKAPGQTGADFRKENLLRPGTPDWAQKQAGVVPPVPPKPYTPDPQLAQLLAAIQRLSQPISLPAPYIPPAKTQAELEQGADAGAKAIGLDRLFGQNFGKRLATRETTPNPEGAQNALRFEFPLFSPQQLQAMTSDELTALDKYLGLKYNTTLQDVLEAQSMVFQAPTAAKRRLVRR